MTFFKTFLQANELEGLKLELEEEKRNSIKIAKGLASRNICQRLKHCYYDCCKKFKSSLKIWYKCPKGTRLYRFSYKLRHDGSCENYTLKSVFGFLGGFLLTYVFFMFFVFQLNFKLSSATIICSLFGSMLTIGLAFSYKVRCIVFLLLPQFFSRRGRQALLAYAFILALTGPAKNTLNNMSILSESLACGQEQLKAAVKQILEAIKVPFYAIKDAIKAVVKAVKEVIKEIKKILLSIKRIVLTLAKIIKSAYQFLRKIISICNKELGTPFQRCTRVFENAITDCNAKLGPLFNWLCSITYLVQSVCYLVKIFDLVCLIVDFINESVIGVVIRKIKLFVRHVRSMFYVRIKFSHSYHFETVQSKTMKEVYAGIITEIKQRSEGLMAIFDLMTCATSLFFIFIIFRVIHYRYKFLTNERFDNRFITKNFRLLDLRRAQLQKETVLPLNHREAQLYINSNSLTLVKSEKLKLSKSAMLLGTATIKLCTHMICDYSLYWVLTKIREHARFQSKIQAPGMPTMHIQGRGLLADLLRGIVNAFRPIGIELEIDTIPCLPDPIPPDYDRYLQIVTSVILCWVLTLLEPYGLRLRHTVMCYYHPLRAKQRIIWLYNHIIRTRSTFLKFARRQLRRKLIGEPDIAKVTCKEYIIAHINSPTVLMCLGSQIQEACLLCGEVFRDKNKEQAIRCATPECKGIYCEQCFSDLQNLCTVCLDPIQYGDLSDIDQERDSSDDEERLKRKKSRKSSKKDSSDGDPGDTDYDTGGDGDTREDSEDTHPGESSDYDSDLGTSYTGDEDEDTGNTTDYSYTYQNDKDIAAEQHVDYPEKFRDLEKQHIPDYASMEYFQDVIVSESESESDSADFTFHSVKEDTLNESSQYHAAYLSDVDYDSPPEHRNAVRKLRSASKENDLELMPLMERGGGDPGMGPFDPYRTRVCCKCGRRRHICTCKQRKLQRNIPPLDLKDMNWNPICQNCTKEHRECTCKELSCQKCGRMQCRCTPRKIYEPSPGSTPKALNQFNVNYTVDNETAKTSPRTTDAKTNLPLRYISDSSELSVLRKRKSETPKKDTEEYDAYTTTGSTGSYTGSTTSSGYRHKVRDYYKRINELPDAPAMRKDNVFSKFINLFRKESLDSASFPVCSKSVLKREERNLGVSENSSPVPPINRNFTVAYAAERTFLYAGPGGPLMGGLVCTVDDHKAKPLDDSEEEDQLSAAAKLNDIDSSDSEISVLDFEKLMNDPGESVLYRNKNYKSDSSSMKGKGEKGTCCAAYSSRYSREPAEKDENACNVKVKRFGTTSEIRKFFDKDQETNLEMHNAYSMNQHDRKCPCGCQEGELGPPMEEYGKKMFPPGGYYNKREENPKYERPGEVYCYQTSPEYVRNEPPPFQPNFNQPPPPRINYSSNYNSSNNPSYNANFHNQPSAANNANEPNSENYPNQNNIINYPPRPNYPRQSNSGNYPIHPTPNNSNYPQNFCEGKVPDQSMPFNEAPDKSRSRRNSFSSPEVTSRTKMSSKYYNQPNYESTSSRNTSNMEYSKPPGRYQLEESSSEIDVYDKMCKKPPGKSKAKCKGCQCCRYNYFPEDQESLCSANTRSSEYMDLAYQNAGDYPTLVDELEDTITQRNKERVQKTLQHFEQISAGAKDPSIPEVAEKHRYTYEPCPCEKYRARNPGQPCYCPKGQCAHCDENCRKYMSPQPQEPHYPQQQPPPPQQSKYPPNAGHVEKVVRCMDPNPNDAGQKYPKFQNKFCNTHWQMDTRSGEWIKVCERNYDFETSYPPLPPPPPPKDDGIYEVNVPRRPPNQVPEGYNGPHKKNCMCNNCRYRRENRRY